MAGAPDPKSEPRIRDIGVLRRLHIRGGECVICGDLGQSLHHLLPKGRGGDDVEVNLVWLCGHGTAGCHGLIEAWDRDARTALGTWLLTHRLAEFHTYLREKLGSWPAADEFLGQNLYIRRAS